MAHTVIRAEGRFELREYSSVLCGVTVTGYVAWDTVWGESVGPGLVPTVREAELLIEVGHGSVRQENLRRRRRLSAACR